MTTVVLVDDHPLVRQGMRAVIDAQPDLEVVGEAADGDRSREGLHRAAAGRRPDGPTDASAERHRGHQAGAREVSRDVGARSHDVRRRRGGLRGCRIGCFRLPPQGIRRSRHRRGDPWPRPRARRSSAPCSPSGCSRGSAAPNPQPSPFPELTEREREILDGVAAGLTNPEIGAKLFLSPKTVANNISVILDKLQVAHRAEAIVKAREAGLGEGASDRSTLKRNEACVDLGLVVIAGR